MINLNEISRKNATYDNFKSHNNPRRSYNTHHVLSGVTEKWSKNLDNNNLIGAVYLDLRRALDCISLDLVLAKPAACGFDKNIVTFTDT